MPAETEKGANGNLDCAADAKEVSDEAVPEDEGCTGESAENVNAEDSTKVEDEIIEEAAVESQEGEGEAEGSQHCNNDVGEHDGEGRRSPQTWNRPWSFRITRRRWLMRTPEKTV
ncbi:hypothetical protein MRX96_036598 [Rhipicephalus microplus]